MNIVTLERFYEFKESVEVDSVKLYISALDHVRKLRFSSMVHLTSIKKLF